MNFQASQTAQTLNFATGLLIVCFSGGAGGIVSAVGALIEEGRSKEHPFTYEATNGVPMWLFLLGRFLVGIGGAIAVLLAALSVNKVTGTSDTGTSEIDKLALAALCFVAGSIGHRLLPMVAKELEKRIGEAERKAEKGAATANEAEEKASLAVKKVIEAEQKADLTANILTALEILQQKDSLAVGITDQTIAALEEYSKLWPRNRRLHIVLARLYKKRGQFSTAIGILKKFIRAKGEPQDVDVGDALFNIACYSVLRMQEASTEQERNQLEEEAFEALETSIRLAPSGAIDARTDEDLAALRTSDRFQTLVRQ